LDVVVVVVVVEMVVVVAVVVVVVVVDEVRVDEAWLAGDGAGFGLAIMRPSSTQ
jgi:hypothetical protein